MRPYAPIPRLVDGTDHDSLLTRVLHLGAPATTQRADLITTSSLRFSLIDIGSEPLEVAAEGDTVLHILWQADESGASLTVDGDSLPIAPGDTACIPGGDRWHLSANQLAVQIVSRARSLAVPIPPTHGQDSFSGNNRCTSYPGTTLKRWKITEPLRLDATETEIILIGLYQPIAMQWRGGVDLLPQAACRVLRAGIGPVTLVPNGLSYLLTL